VTTQVMKQGSNSTQNVEHRDEDTGNLKY